jgi:hypothetical protein
MGQCVNLVVDCAVGCNCLVFQSTALPKVTHSPGVSRWCWKIYINLQYLPCAVSKGLLQPAGALLIFVRSLSVPIMGCAVGVEIGEASQWRCGLPLDKRSGRSLFPYEKVCLCRCRNWHYLVYGGAWKLEILLRGDVDFRSTDEVDVLIAISF